MTRPARIVIVDDEDIVLTSLRSFLVLETDYDVVTYQSPRAALESMSQNPPDLVISDFLMPDMDGLQLLSEVKERFPNSPRILLTGYADKENAIQAINRVGLFQYLEKPWDNEQLKIVLRNALRQSNLERLLQEKIDALDAALRHRDDLAARNEAVRRDLALAEAVQRGLLPDQLPRSPIGVSAIYEPSGTIGGDFYDTACLSDGRWAVLLADASGHGIPAALSTTLIKSAFGRSIEESSETQTILRSMNRILHAVLPDSVFVAAQLAVIASDHASLELVNAGNPHPILWRAAESTPERIASNGLLLGMADDSLYPSETPQQITLDHGDRLLLFSDGLTEATSSTGEQFEDARLTGAIERLQSDPIERILADLSSEAQAWHTADFERDDLTIIGLERCPESED